MVGTYPDIHLYTTRCHFEGITDSSFTMSDFLDFCTQNVKHLIINKLLLITLHCEHQPVLYCSIKPVRHCLLHCLAAKRKLNLSNWSDPVLCERDQTGYVLHFIDSDDFCFQNIPICLISFTFNFIMWVIYKNQHLHNAEWSSLLQNQDAHLLEMTFVSFCNEKKEILYST